MLLLMSSCKVLLLLLIGTEDAFLTSLTCSHALAATAVLLQLGPCNVFHVPSATDICSTPLLVYITGRWCTYIGCVIINQHFIARLGSLVTFMAALSGTCCVNVYIATIDCLAAVCAVIISSVCVCPAHVCFLTAM
jgi:hypothetical protein